MKRNLSSQTIKAMAIGMAVALGSSTAISGIVGETLVEAYASDFASCGFQASATKEGNDLKVTLTTTESGSKTFSHSDGTLSELEIVNSDDEVVISGTAGVTTGQASNSDTLDITIANANLSNLVGNETSLTIKKLKSETISFNSSNLDFDATEGNALNVTISGSLGIDKTAPTLEATGTYSKDGTTITLTASESLAEVNTANDNNFEIRKNAGSTETTITNFKVDSSNDTKVVLTLSGELEDGTYTVNYKTQANSLKDKSENKLATKDGITVEVSSAPVEESTTFTFESKGIGTYTFEKNEDDTVTLTNFTAGMEVASKAATANSFANGRIKVGEKTYNLTKIGNGATALTEITTDALKGQTTYVTEIANDAFKDNNKITKLSFPNVNKVGDSAFNGATSLTSIELGTNVEDLTLGTTVFAGSSALTSVITNKANEEKVQQKLTEDSIEDAEVETVNRKPVTNQNGTYVLELTDIDLVEGINGVATLVAFQPTTAKTKAGSDTLKNGIATVNNKDYLLVQIGNGIDSITTIEEDSTALLTETSYVIDIADNAFNGGSIPELLILPSIDSIGDNAFANLQNTKPFLVLTDKFDTKGISKKAFGTEEKSLPYSTSQFIFAFGSNLDNFKFENINVQAIMNPYFSIISEWYYENKPEEIISRYQYDFEALQSNIKNLALTNFEDITNETTSKSKTFKNEMQKFATQTPIVINKNNAKSTNFTFLNGVISFNNGQSFTLTQMGNGESPVGSAMINEEIDSHMANVTTVKANAFEGATKLKYLNLPKVEKIEKEAFKGCTNLTEVKLGTAHNNSITIASDAFVSCTSLKKVETNSASKNAVKDAVKNSGSNATVNGESSSGSISSGSGSSSSSGLSGGGAVIGTNNDTTTETNTSNNTNSVVEDKELSFDVISLPSIEGEAKVFADVSANHWAKAHIDKLSTAGIINGANGMFNPNGQTKRADVTIMLVNLLGLTPQSNNKFVDVNPNAYYAPYIGTASTYGIVNGSNGMFNPENVISRQDTMVMIAQILKGLDLNVNTDTTTLNQFSDASKVSSYATESVAILVNSGIISGNNGKLNPTAPVTRAEMATIISKLYDILAAVNK